MLISKHYILYRRSNDNKHYHIILLTHDMSKKMLTNDVEIRVEDCTGANPMTVFMIADRMRIVDFIFLGY